MAEGLTLVVMAAGMGSRFGGLKQVEPVGPAGETLLDYSIYDARNAGFERIVFVIRKDIEAIFRTQVGAKYEALLPVEYVYQELDALPEGCTPPADRTKPWGTGHAVLVATEAVGGAFGVINADDFYGSEAFRMLAENLRKAAPRQQTLIAYELQNTLSSHGTVSRGICQVDDGGKLRDIEEITELAEREDGSVKGKQGSGEEQTFRRDAPVSMNLWGFTSVVGNLLRSRFRDFFDQHGQAPKSEFHLPKAIDDSLKAGAIEVEVACSPGRWFGVTYREDGDKVRAAIRVLVEAGRYPSPLFPAVI